MTWTTKRPYLALLASLLLLPFAVAGCAQDFSEPRAFACPTVPVEDFRNVSAVLEKRCGSLDCHGNLARPLRLVGNTGLRLFTPEEFANPEMATGVPGGVLETTEQELEHNRLSLCGIEPRLTELVLRGDASPDELMVIRKPSLRERHKGSQVFLRGGAEESCLGSWFKGEVIVAECVEAVQAP